MSDLISRKSLIDILAKYKFGAIKSESEREYTKETVMNFVKEQPSVESPTWIPCSERMPTEKEAWDYNADENLYEPNEFIVQVKGAKLPTVAMFDGETFTHGYAEDGYGFMDEIIAWMPLPEPYEGE